MTDTELDCIESRIGSPGFLRVGAAPVIESDLRALVTEIRRLRQTLAFYADEDMYDTFVFVSEPHRESPPTVLEDRGEQARRALEGKTP